MLRADVHKPYFRKFLYVFLGCLFYTGLCFKDAWISYPKQYEIAATYEAIPDDDNRREIWQKVAKEKGWPAVTPQKSAKDILSGIGQQYLQAILCGIIGIPALLKWLSGKGAWVEGDESLIRNHKGVEVPIDSITAIDKRKWEDKGIAKISYEVDGKSKRFVMDDFKFDRAAMGKLMLHAEAHLSEEQVTGDTLERMKPSRQEQAELDEDFDEDAEPSDDTELSEETEVSEETESDK